MRWKSAIIGAWIGLVALVVFPFLAALTIGIPIPMVGMRRDWQAAEVSLSFTILYCAVSAFRPLIVAVCLGVMGGAVFAQ